MIWLVNIGSDLFFYSVWIGLRRFELITLWHLDILLLYTLTTLWISDFYQIYHTHMTTQLNYQTIFLVNYVNTLRSLFTHWIDSNRLGLCVWNWLSNLCMCYIPFSDIIFIQFGNRLKSVLQLIPQFDSMKKVTQRRSQRVHVVN
jgi:hypothetical protein